MGVREMCYSALVEQSHKRLALRFKARVQMDRYESLFKARADGEKLYIGRGMESAFLRSSEPNERRVAQYIREFHAVEEKKKSDELARQSERLRNAEAQLSKKGTQKALEEMRIATSKIEKLSLEIDFHRTHSAAEENVSRIFPLHYVSMITADTDGQRMIRPFRYLLRPFGQPESFDRNYSGCYNARKDNLQSPFWKPLFGRQHGILVVSKFFENVPTTEYLKRFTVDARQLQKNIVLCFDPGVEFMLIPTLWDRNVQPGKLELLSTAILTDEPPPEIAATGHTRCPIVIKEGNLDPWLHPQKCSLDALYDLLDDRERPLYQHSIVDAA